MSLTERIGPSWDGRGGGGGRRVVSTYQSVCAIRFPPSERFLADSIEADMYVVM